MTLHISREEARHFLATYHFTQGDLIGVFARLGTVQYDPLNPVGRNPDLVLQARVPDYRVDDWQRAAYGERSIYDTWDKQACLVPMSDWPMRALIRTMYQPYHDREILRAEAEAAAVILATIDAQGPLSSAEFEDKARYEQNSWYGLTKTKRILRALWACGQLVTHHRQAGRHYYDRPERVIPAEHYNAPPLLDIDAYHRWIMAKRAQAVGLLRPASDPSIWSACGDAATRKQAITHLLEDGTLTHVRVGEKGWSYYMLTSALPLLESRPPEPRVLFLGPLDSFLWDRKSVLQLFDFDYLWEVYKPPEQRKCGYYVLPIFYGTRFLGRLDSRLDGGTWTISRWWWEPDVLLDANTLDALRCAARRFLQYLRASALHVGEQVDAVAREALQGV